MRRTKLGTAFAVVGAATALATVVSAATSAYTSPTLKITISGSSTVIAGSGSASDDATARVAIYAPSGTAVTAPAPGATIGSVTAVASALALGGALLPLKGTVVVPAAGTPPPASQAQCIQNRTPTATWGLKWDPVAGQQVPTTPVYVLPTAGTETALGAFAFVICLPPPDIPEANGGAPFGAKFTGVQATLQGVLTPPATGLWVAVWTPYQPATGQPNATGSVASPSLTAPGSLAVGAKRTGARVTVGGTVTQGGRPVSGAAVKIVRGKTAGRLTSFRTLRTNSQGTFAITSLAKAGTYFRASTAVAARANPAVCASLASSLPVPCVNGTSSGFTATSKVVRGR